MLSLLSEDEWLDMLASLDSPTTTGWTGTVSSRRASGSAGLRSPWRADIGPQWTRSPIARLRPTLSWATPLVASDQVHRVQRLASPDGLVQARRPNASPSA